MFKIGDRVRFEDNDNTGCSGSVRGAFYIVNSAEYILEGQLLGLHPENKKYRKLSVLSIRCSLAPKSNVEELIRKANEGREAAEALEGMEGVEFIRWTGDTWRYLPEGYFNESRFRLEPPSVFEPFTIGSWTVKLEGGTLHIGCKTVLASKFLAWYAARLLGDIDSADRAMTGYAYKIIGERDGMKFYFSDSESHILPWNALDKIITALKKAGIK